MTHQEIRLVNGRGTAFVHEDGKARYGIYATPFGQCLVARSAQGIIAVDFRDAAAELKAAVEALEKRWPNLAFSRDDKADAAFVKRMVTEGQEACLKDVPLHLKGTAFQLKVWQALLTIPDGHISDYSRIAQQLGVPKGTRAVGGANGRNPVAFLVPCHRVLAKGGGLGGYATGLPRKEAMLAFEANLFEKRRA